MYVLIYIVICFVCRRLDTCLLWNSINDMRVDVHVYAVARTLPQSLMSIVCYVYFWKIDKLSEIWNENNKHEVNKCPQCIVDDSYTGWLYLTLSPPNKLSSAKFLVCLHFHSASMLLKICENVVWVTIGLYLDETASYSPSHPDPSCLHMGL